MGGFTVDGLEGLSMSLSKLENLPDSLLLDMIDAESEVVLSAQKQKAATMLRGPYHAGGVAGGLYKKRPKKTSDGVQQVISLQGTQHGERLGTIAFVNEFGKRGQPPRPFIKTANEESMGRAAEAAERIYDAWLDSQGL